MHDTNDAFVFPTSETMEPTKTGPSRTTGDALVEAARECVRDHPVAALGVALLGGFLVNRFFTLNVNEENTI
jgi:hypothetical protein